MTDRVPHGASNAAADVSAGAAKDATTDGAAHPAAFRPGGLKVLSPREASMFASLADAVICPAGAYPAIARTTTVFYFDDYLARSAALNRLGLRVALWAAELAPLALGFGRRLRRLDRDARERFVARVDASSNPAIYAVAAIVKALTAMSYYGDDEVLPATGYEPEKILERGRNLRAAEGRP